MSITVLQKTHPSNPANSWGTWHLGRSSGLSFCSSLTCEAVILEALRALLFPLEWVSWRGLSLRPTSVKTQDVRRSFDLTGWMKRRNFHLEKTRDGSVRPETAFSGLGRCC